MKWKSDSIEQFVKYKIEHPQQSYQSLKNYQLQKKQNEHLQRMYKQLQQMKISRDYFMNQLHKLKRITQNEGERNLSDIKQIDRKCQIMAEKLNQVKIKKKTQVKKTKSQIISQYEQRIQQIKNSFQNELNSRQQQINQVKQQLQQLHVSKKTQKLLQKITQTNQKISCQKALFGERTIKLKLIKSLQKQKQQKLKLIQQKQTQLKQKKQQQKSIKRKQAQMQLELYQQMKKRTQNVQNQILKEIKNKLFISTPTSTITSMINLEQRSPLKGQQNSKQRPNSMQQKSTIDNQISEQILFNPHIDFNYTKKSKNSSPVKNAQQKISQPQQNIQQIQKNINLFRKFIQQLHEEHQIDHQPQQKNIQKASQYLISKFNHSSQNPYTELDLMIESVKQKIQSRKVQSDILISQQNDKLTSQENTLTKKQKELDKQIQHLQNKVQKTQLQITKKNKVTI